MAARMTVRGIYKIDPPLKWSEIRGSAFFVQSSEGRCDRDVAFQVFTMKTETETGFTVTITCEWVVPFSSAPYDPSNLLDDVKELRAELGVEHSLVGHVVVYNLDEPDGVRRIVSDEAGVREEWATMLWPDGSPVGLD